MDTQNQIKRTLSTAEAVSYIRNQLDGRRFPNRTKAAQFVCRHFGFYDLRGEMQLGGCLKALRELEAAGKFALPSAKKTHRQPLSPKRLLEPVPAAEAVPEKAEAVQELQLVLVTTEGQMRVWNEMMIREHPRGAGPFVGRQLRYLISSRHGWLGGLGFAAAALQLADRDRWIGWDVSQRRANLHTIVGLSRFLIRPSVRCRNLASRVLGISLTMMAADFEQRYGYRPLLVESFVDTSLYSGTCFRAANWIRVGRTQGRGRQDRLRESAETVKEIYVYPVESDFRARIGLAPEAGLGALSPAEGLETAGWAEKEFSGAPVGDRRLSNRLVDIAGLKAEQPGRSFSGVAGGDWPTVKGYYRLIDMPDNSAVNMPNILFPHRERTLRRMKGQKTVLCIQDGTDLNYSSLAECEGLGVIGTNQTSSKSRGLHLHSTLAVSTKGLPLGVLRADCSAPGLKTSSKKDKHAIPIEEKDTFRWIEGLRDIGKAGEEMPHTRLIGICDREADFFELFDEQRRNPRVDLLIRAKHDRNIVSEPQKLFASLKSTPVRAAVTIHVPRRSARPKRGNQQARPKRPTRTAELALRYMRVQFRPSRYRKDTEPIEVWAIHAVEQAPPPDTEPVEWFLLTTIPIDAAETAVTCLRWYCLRWRIEDWHRVLKSGCCIEELAHRSAVRLKRAIAINLVIAWRIMLMTLLGRETPELPAEILFSDFEIEVLRAYAKKNG
tara:strand:- start:196 stop:2358 length:2163 start_codon:yes stop_codon:yes gene_type:complete